MPALWGSVGTQVVGTPRGWSSQRPIPPTGVSRPPPRPSSRGPFCRPSYPREYTPVEEAGQAARHRGMQAAQALAAGLLSSASRVLAEEDDHAHDEELHHEDEHGEEESSKSLRIAAGELEQNPPCLGSLQLVLPCTSMFVTVQTFVPSQSSSCWQLESLVESRLCLSR